MLEQGRIVTWLDRNSEYADDLDAVQELLDDATLITINANPLQDQTPHLCRRHQVPLRALLQIQRACCRPQEAPRSFVCWLVIGLLLGAVIAQAEEFGHVLYLGKTIG